MTLSMNMVKVTLVLLSAAGFYLIWYLVLNNGTSEHMAHIRDVGPRLLPGSEAPLKTSYTGIAALDYQLTVLTLFFWEAVDGSMPNASLQLFHFGGQCVAAVGLLLVEGQRSSHGWNVITFIMIWSLVAQNISFAVTVPLYLALHLSTSPTVSSLDPTDFHLDLDKVWSIPYSMTLGFILPAMLLSLPAPSILTFDQKQIFIAIWQAFPLWVELLQQAISFVTTQDLRKIPSFSKNAINQQSLSAVRVVYIFLLIIAGFTHISTLSIMTISKLFPGLFAAEYAGILNPSMVFMPATISASTKMPSSGAGAFLLFQYDEFVGSAALVIWASVLFGSTSARVKALDGWPTLMLLTIISTILVGPVGCAAALIWARDEMVFKESIKDGKKID